MAKAIAALALVSSLISIITAAKQLYDGAKDSSELPQAFKDVATRLPLIVGDL